MKKYDTNGLEALRNAVVENAAKDYLRAKRRILKKLQKGIAYERINEVFEVEDLERWFLSEKFERFCNDVDGEYILNKLNAMLEDEDFTITRKRIGREHKKHGT